MSHAAGEHNGSKKKMLRKLNVFDVSSAEAAEEQLRIKT